MKNKATILIIIFTFIYLGITAYTTIYPITVPEVNATSTKQFAGTYTVGEEIGGGGGHHFYYSGWRYGNSYIISDFILSDYGGGTVEFSVGEGGEIVLRGELYQVQITAGRLILK